MENEIKYFSMFTGVGGFELGIGKLAKCIGFSEIDKYTNELLKKKFPKIKNYGDATKIDAQALPNFDMLCGGFPCQAFSIAGKRKGLEDTRGTMFFEIARIVKIKRPKYLFLENVKGLLSHEKGQTKTFKIIGDCLEELGYEIQWMVFNSKFFGVPQNRERLFIIGNLKGESRPKILPFEEFDKKDKSERSLRRCCSPTILTAQENIPILDFVADFRHDEGLRIRKEEVSNTLQAQARQDGTAGQTIIKIKGEKARRLTPLECERLQGLPDNWTEGFSDSQRYKMIGNAVTVNVIRAIAIKLLQNKK